MIAQAAAATNDLDLALGFIQDNFADELSDFDDHHHSVKDLIRHLSTGQSTHPVGRQRRSLPDASLLDCPMSVEDGIRYCHRLHLSIPDRQLGRFQHKASGVRQFFVVHSSHNTTHFSLTLGIAPLYEKR